MSVSWLSTRPDNHDRWSVAAIAADDDMKPWRDPAGLSRVTEPDAEDEPTTPTTFSAAFTRSHAR